MNGFLITFYTELNQKYKKKPLHEWLIEVARELGLRGATVIPGSEGIDHTGKFHSSHFFELVDQPIKTQMAITTEEAELLLNYLDKEDVHIFYVKTPVEFGTVGSKN